MSLNVQQKLVIAFAVTSLSVTLLAFLAMLLSFRSGFLHYVNEHRYQSVEALSELVNETVTSQEQWQALIRHRKTWDDLVSNMLRGKNNITLLSPGMPMGAPKHGPPHSTSHPSVHDSSDIALHTSNRHFIRHHPANHDGTGPPHRRKGKPPVVQPFLLLDAQKRSVYRNMSARSGDLWTLPVQVDGETVGYVGLDMLMNFTSDADAVFVNNQTQYFILIAIIASVLGVLVACVVARWMVLPVRRLDKAMSALMRRDYDAHVRYESTDEIGRLVSSFNLLAKSLGDYDRSQQQWIADISHELRTPLSTLRGEVEAMQDGVRSLSVKRLYSLEEEILRLQRIVDDLHQLSLSDAGAMRYTFEPLFIVPLVSSVIERNLSTLAQHHLEHNIIVEGDVSTIYGDADRLVQLLDNLLQNSLRYTNDGGQLRIKVLFQNNKVDIFWEDSEPGVQGHSLDKLFDRLFREEQSRNREKGGSGLGLSIVKAIVEAHQGKVVASQSSLGGVVIHIELPLMR